MKTVRLSIRYDDNTGAYGFAINGLNIPDDIFIATEGRLIAHDLIEHQNGARNIGSVGDELEALGAVWFVRGQYADLNRPDYGRYSPEENLASDIVQIFRQFMRDGFNWPAKKTKEHYFDENFQAILDKAREDLPKEYSVDDYYPECTEEQAQEMVERYLTNAIHYLRTGARKAEKRFKKVSKHNPDGCANQMFWNIAQAIDEQKQYMSEEYQGLEFRLSYSVDDARVVPLWDDDDYRQYE